MSQRILQQLQSTITFHTAQRPAPDPRALNQRPVDVERIRRVLVSIRDCAEWPDTPDHLKLYWISAYTNSLLMRLADRTEEADLLLARCNKLAAQMRRLIELTVSDEAGAIVPETPPVPITVPLATVPLTNDEVNA